MLIVIVSLGTGTRSWDILTWRFVRDSTVKLRSPDFVDVMVMFSGRDARDTTSEKSRIKGEA